MCHTLLNDANVYRLLLRIDEDLAGAVRADGCPHCGGVLHSARYPRKPRGVPRNLLGADYAQRLSFCCAEAECRRRTTPASVRFLGRRVYLGVVVVLLSAFANGVSAARAGWRGARLGVARRTLERWRKWWREGFLASPFWQARRAHFMPALAPRTLPAGLLERFAGATLGERLRHLLAFLAPLGGHAP
ncbi:MAG: hypothetical protein U1F68_20730 [Gammaproteobacteria bacterium]